MATQTGAQPVEAVQEKPKVNDASAAQSAASETLSQQATKPGDQEALDAARSNVTIAVNDALKSRGLIPDFDVFAADDETADGATVLLAQRQGAAGRSAADAPERQGDNRAGEVPGDARAPRTTLDASAVQTTTDRVREALEAGDAARLERLLGPLLKADREAIQKAYRDKYSPNGGANALETDLRSKLKESDFQRIKSILDRSDNRTNDAGQLAQVLSRLNEGDRKADYELREIFATLSKAQVDEMKREYLATYGKSVEQAIAETANVSEATKRSLAILSKGSDNRTGEDNKDLAQIALETKDLWLLHQALRGEQTGGPAETARRELSNNTDFMERVRNTFPNNRVAIDFVTQGKTSLATIIDANNKGAFFGTPDKANVELALEHATLTEREAYARGRDLADQVKQKTRTEDSLTAAEKADLNSYRSIRTSLEALSSGGSSAPDVLNDVKPDPKRYLSEALGITPEDLDKYRTDEGFRRVIDSRLRRMDEAPRELTKSLLRRLQNGEDISTLQPVEKLLYDRATGASPYRTLLDAEKMLEQDPALGQRIKLLISGVGIDQYLRTGGTEDSLARDLALLNVMNDAIRTASRTSGDSMRTGNLQTDNSFVRQLLDNGKLNIAALATLNFPKPVIDQRLEGASQSDREWVRDYMRRFSQTEEESNKDLARWEDKLLYGGSLVGKLADAKNKDDIYRTIEGMSAQDYTRLTDSRFAARYLKDVENAINVATDDPSVRQRAMELLRAKMNAGSFEASTQQRRSVLDVGDERGSLVNALVNMRRDEQERYRTDEVFRNQVNERVSRLNEIDKLFAERMLGKVMSDGAIPKMSELTGMDKLLYSVVSGKSRFDVARDLEAVLQDKELRDRVSKDRLLHPGDPSFLWTAHESMPRDERVLAEIINTVAGDLAMKAPNNPGVTPSIFAGSRPYVESLIRDGKLSAINKVQLGFPKEQILTEIAGMDQRSRDGMLDLMRLSPEERKVADNIFRQGNATLADRLRLQTLSGPGKPEDFKDELAGLNDTQRRALINEYATKYNSVLSDDFLKNVDPKNRAEFEKFFSLNRPDGRQDYYDSLGKWHRSENAFGSDASRRSSERALQIFSESLQDAQAKGLNLTPEQQAQLTKYFSEALDSYQGSKEEYARKLLAIGEGALLVAAGVLAVAASGGTLAPEIVAVTAAAMSGLSAAGRVAVMQQVLGNDFDQRSNGVLKELGIGFASGLVTFGPIGTLAIAESIAARSATRVATAFAARTNLSSQASGEVVAELTPAIRKAAQEGRHVTQAELDQIASRLRSRGVLTEAQEAELRGVTNATAETLGDEVLKNVPQLIQEVNFAKLGETGRAEVIGKFRNSLKSTIDNPAVQSEITARTNTLRAAEEALVAGDLERGKELMLSLGLPERFVKNAKSTDQLLGRVRQELKPLEEFGQFSRGELYANPNDAELRTLSQNLQKFLAHAKANNPELNPIFDGVDSSSRNFALALANERIPQTLGRLLDPEVKAENLNETLYNLFKGGNGSDDLMKILSEHPELLNGTGGARFTDAQVKAAVAYAKQRIDANLAQRAVIGSDALPAGFGAVRESGSAANAARGGMMTKEEIISAIDSLPESQRKAALEFVTKGNGKTYSYKMINTDDGRTIMLRFDPSPQGDVSKAYMVELTPAGERAVMGPAGQAPIEMHIQFEKVNGQIRIRDIKAEMSAQDKPYVYNADPAARPDITLDFASSGFRTQEEYIKWLKGLVSDIR